MDANTVLDHLAEGSPSLVKPALQAVPALATELAALLPGRLAEFVRRLEADPEDDSAGEAFWLMYAAGGLRLTQTHAMLVRLFSVGEDRAYDLWADLVTEDGKVLLADTYAGDTRPLESLAANRDVSVWCRDAAVNALAILSIRGVLPTAEVTAIFTRLADATLRTAREPESGEERRADEVVFATNLVTTAALELNAAGLRPVVWPLVEAELFDEDFCRLATIEQGFTGSYPREPRRGEPMGSDLWARVKWWAAFDVIEGREKPKAKAPPRPAEPHATKGRTGPKTGRNDPCPCGSGKKFKKCCGI
ncbi:MAG: DUF1186 domain-containing protein [Opitutaceae bacterium]|jgi:hypothetical protein